MVLRKVPLSDWHWDSLRAKQRGRLSGLQMALPMVPPTESPMVLR